MANADSKNKKHAKKKTKTGRSHGVGGQRFSAIVARYEEDHKEG